METTGIIGKIYRGYIGVMLGLYWGYIGKMGNEMEITIQGLGFTLSSRIP